MSTLIHVKEHKAACAAGVTASGNYLPTTLWETGIPNDSVKQMDVSQWVQSGSGAGAVITVWGSMRTKFDNSNPTWSMTVPVTNGNTFTAISGVLKKQKSSEQCTFNATIHGATTTKVGMTGSGISNTANETWDFKFTYTLT